ncbi:DUF637 domain-containing protein [Aeromonas hydrophila]|uniref:DUF637 domain-containing protein n=1 Tax=Aeromonas hydrophila TaxID=644 RepID=UPI001C5A750E|nr:DUF637 domain-containing protein [Aeromonas hydrophila]EGX6952924.1 DUF637 domain-containing protein [Aeromonas hydrophila]MBW3832313.1 hypothetical protein [Aeromonas hydrophila]MBW5264304.1 hypothetical protein [Aeromonas hydrophila]MBW5276367.1 hypothetical protein [Aeromonas hydrophila]
MFSSRKFKYHKTAFFVCTTIFCNSISYSYASTYSIPSDEILSSMLNSPSIEFTGTTPYLYKTTITPAPTTHDHIESLYQYYWKNDIQALSPKFIPIYNSNGITIFIPQVKQNFRVGDAFVDQGIIRAQISRALNRSFIPGYESHDEMITTLYKNGLDMARLYNLKFGSRFNGVTSSDLIWPEYRVINGANVLVPVVYLTNSTMSSLLTGTSLSYGSMDINAANFTVENANVIGIRDALIKLSNNFINVSSLFVSANDISVMAAGNIDNLSGTISAKNVNLTANAIKNETLVYVYNYQYGHNSKVADIARITAVGDININSFSDFVNIGANLSAQGLLKINAQGNIIISSAKDAAMHLQSGDGWSVGSRHLQNIQSHLTAGEELSLIAGDSIYIEGADIESKGLVEFLANNGIQILNDINYTSSNYEFSFGSSGVFGNKGSVKEEKLQEALVRTLIKAGKDLRIRTNMGDVTLRAVKVISDGATEIVNLSGGINIPLAKIKDYYSYIEQDSNLISMHNEGNGHNIEIAGYSEFLSKGGLFLDARNGVYIEYEMPKSNTTLEEIALKFSSVPELAWMASLINSNNVNFQAVQLAYDEWDYEVNALSPAAAAIVAIAVAIAMPAVGVGLSGALSNAALSSIVTQASTSLLGNGFDIGATLKELGSKESIRGLATSVATAGALYGLGAYTPPGYTTNTSPMFGSFADLHTQMINSMYQNVVRSGVNTMLNGGNLKGLSKGAMQGMIASSISYLGEKIANKVHTQSVEYKKNNTSDNYIKLMKTISHAALGCTMGMADKLNTHRPDLNREKACLSGAVGGVMGEFLGNQKQEELQSELSDDLVEFTKKYEGKTQLTAKDEQDIKERAVIFVEKWREHNADLIGLQSALIAATMGLDVNLTNQTAVNASKNNAFFIPFLLVIGEIAATQAIRLTITMLSKRAVQLALTNIGYGLVLGQGDVIRGLVTIGKGEDPISQAINEGKETAVSFVINTIKSQGGEAAIAQFQQGLLALTSLPAPLTDGIQIAFKYLDEKTGATVLVNSTWGQLTPTQKEYLIAADVLISGSIKIPGINSDLIRKINQDRVKGTLKASDLPTSASDPAWKKIFKNNKDRYEITGHIAIDELHDILKENRTMRLAMKDHKGLELGKGMRNDGKLGEKVALDYVESLTGARYVPMQNSSNNGADGLRFIRDKQGRITGIDVLEVKSSKRGDTSAVKPSDNPRKRLEGWQLKALRGEFGPVSQETQGMLDALKLANLENVEVRGVIVRIEIPETAQSYLGVTLHPYGNKM